MRELVEGGNNAVHLSMCLLVRVLLAVNADVVGYCRDRHRASTLLCVIWDVFVPFVLLRSQKTHSWFRPTLCVGSTVLALTRERQVHSICKRRRRFGVVILGSRTK